MVIVTVRSNIAESELKVKLPLLANIEGLPMTVLELLEVGASTDQPHTKIPLVFPIL